MDSKNEENTQCAIVNLLLKRGLDMGANANCPSTFEMLFSAESRQMIPAFNISLLAFRFDSGSSFCFPHTREFKAIPLFQTTAAISAGTQDCFVSTSPPLVNTISTLEISAALASQSPFLHLLAILLSPPFIAPITVSPTPVMSPVLQPDIPLTLSFPFWFGQEDSLHSQRIWNVYMNFLRFPLTQLKREPHIFIGRIKRQPLTPAFMRGVSESSTTSSCSTVSSSLCTSFSTSPRSSTNGATALSSGNFADSGADNTMFSTLDELWVFQRDERPCGVGCLRVRRIFVVSHWNDVDGLPSKIKKIVCPVELALERGRIYNTTFRGYIYCMPLFDLRCGFEFSSTCRRHEIGCAGRDASVIFASRPAMQEAYPPSLRQAFWDSLAQRSSTVSNKTTTAVAVGCPVQIYTATLRSLESAIRPEETLRCTPSTAPVDDIISSMPPVSRCLYRQDSATPIRTVTVIPCNNTFAHTMTSVFRDGGFSSLRRTPADADATDAEDDVVEEGVYQYVSDPDDAEFDTCPMDVAAGTRNHKNQSSSDEEDGARGGGESGLVAQTLRDQGLSEIEIAAKLSKIAVDKLRESFRTLRSPPPPTKPHNSPSIRIGIFRGSCAGVYLTPKQSPFPGVHSQAFEAKPCEVTCLSHHVTTSSIVQTSQSEIVISSSNIYESIKVPSLFIHLVDDIVAAEANKATETEDPVSNRESDPESNQEDDNDEESDDGDNDDGEDDNDPSVEALFQKRTAAHGRFKLWARRQCTDDNDAFTSEEEDIDGDEEVRSDSDTGGQSDDDMDSDDEMGQLESDDPDADGEAPLNNDSFDSTELGFDFQIAPDVSSQISVPVVIIASTVVMCNAATTSTSDAS